MTIFKSCSDLSRRTLGGFSLVEVALAMGVIAFAGLALVGLLGVGLDAQREAREETACGLVARYVYASLQADAFSAEAPGPGTQSPFAPSDMETGQNTRYFFTRDGSFLGSTLPASATPGEEAFFLAEAEVKRPSPALAAGRSAGGVSPLELRSVALRIRWPVAAGSGSVPAAAREARFAFLIGKGIYDASLEGKR